MHEEGQLVGRVGHGLVQLFQNNAVGDGARRIDQAVQNRQQQRQNAPGVLHVLRLSALGLDLLVLVGFDDAQDQHARGHQQHGDQTQRQRRLLPNRFTGSSGSFSPRKIRQNSAAAAPEVLQMGDEMDSSM